MQAVSPAISSKIQRFSSSSFVGPERSKAAILAHTHPDCTRPPTVTCLFGLSTQLFLQVLQAGGSPTDAGSSRYASWSPKGESKLSRRVMAVGLRLRVWVLCCLVCNENVSHARFHGNTHRDLFDRRSFQTHCRRIIVPETELDLCRRTSSLLHRSEVEESRAGPRRSYLTLA
jgi:hypothetical protein